ncbi:hypothetical protein OQA88_3992 [Cercophora sp. LCS_1]
MILRSYDNHAVPRLGLGVQFDTLIIALVTVVRVSMSEIVEASISQGAWLWVSERAQQRSRHTAKLSDFGMFDEASRGIWGSLRLLWKMRLRHLGCVGAFIVVMTHGFEAVSQEMVTFEQRPRRLVGGDSNPAPAPARSEVWDTYVRRGYLGDFVPAFSTKAAIYSGIISAETPVLAASCETANCSWPVVPTLAACGACTALPVAAYKNQTTRMWIYSTPSGTSLESSMDAVGQSSFRVSPSNGTVYPYSSDSHAYFSVFDTLTALSISVDGGVQNETIIGNWSTTALSRGSHGAEHVFVDIPFHQLNADNRTRYAVTHEAMTAMRGFMASTTSGTVHADSMTVDYTSDWVEAMWNATDSLDVWISALAASITTDIRQHGMLVGQGTSQRYDGDATELVPFTIVRWSWMFYPCVMILLSVCYLFHTIVASARDGVSVWKANVLPMLFCRLDGSIRSRVGNGMDEPDGLDERVGELRVAMYRREDGQWGFRAVSVEEEA